MGKQDNNKMPKKLGFKDFLLVDYKPGEPDLIKKNAKKRKKEEGETSESTSAMIAPPSKKHYASKKDAFKNANGKKVYKKTFIHPSTGQKSTSYFVGEEILDERKLTVSQRRQMGFRMKRLAPRIKIARQRALKRTADPEIIQKRAKKQARDQLFKRISKGKSKSDVSPQRRIEIEKRLEKMKGRIDKLTRRLIPKVRKLDRERKQQGKGKDKDD